MSENTDSAAKGSFTEILKAFFILGLTSFGGPVAHLGYFRTAFVERRRWLSDAAYADLVALCQFMPGPASSQVGMGLGLMRGGYAGALAAWLGFTLPSAIVLAAFGLGVVAFGDISSGGWLTGLKLAAVAVVANALWDMARSLAPDRERASIAAIAAIVLLIWPTPLAQLGVILIGAVVGLVWLKAQVGDSDAEFAVPVSRRAGVIGIAGFFLLLGGLPLLAIATGNQAFAYFDAFYRAGALVFGGGHVVLPLLQAEVVGTGWVTPDAFLAGYGAAQAVPGPLFTFAAYLGAVTGPAPSGLLGAALCLVAIFLPSAFLVVGLLPFWAQLRKFTRARRALAGVNAAVVGVLGAAFYSPVFTAGVQVGAHLALAVALFALLHWWKLAPWLVVILGALGGATMTALGWV